MPSRFWPALLVTESDWAWFRAHELFIRVELHVEHDGGGNDLLWSVVFRRELSSHIPRQSGSFGGRTSAAGVTATNKFRPLTSGDTMRDWSASAVIVLLAAFPASASAQVNCAGIPPGPGRTDCYLGLSQLYQAQSDLAAAKARAQSDAAWYRAITGTVPQIHKTRRRR